MRLRASSRRIGGVTLLGAASAVALAALAWTGASAQDAPESILPPGFGQPPPASNPSAPAGPSTPASPAEGGATPARPSSPAPSSRPRPPADVAELESETLDLSNVTIVPPDDLPPEARRGTDRIGLASASDSFGDTAFAGSSGAFLQSTMRSIDAPIASRWASIALRRALVVDAPTPADVDGADWTAERAWLLLRMGEADNARGLVARVDSDRYSPKLYEVAMQAALASGDPASLCAVAGKGAAVLERPAWPLAEAMCAGLSGEAGTASGIVNQTRSRRRARGIDVLLAEKVIGAGANTKRVITIEWEGVEQLTAWRYGLAAATGVTIPPRLLSSTGPQVQAWHARAPLYSATARAPMADRAATMGVFSNAALVDLYSSIWDESDEADRGGTLAQTLFEAYRGTDAARLSALRTLWKTDDATDPYARQILVARAAALITPGTTEDGEDIGRLIASMLSVGLDLQAARWGDRVVEGSVAWGLLALGAPRSNGTVSASTVTDVPAGDGDRRIKFLIAGLAGLERIDGDDATDLAEQYAIGLNRENSWTKALEKAVVDRAPGTVALLAAAGMQTREWRDVPPEHLYRIVSAMRRVGLEPEARMIAVEAVSRS